MQKVKKYSLGYYERYNLCVIRSNFSSAFYTFSSNGRWKHDNLTFYAVVDMLPKFSVTSGTREGYIVISSTLARVRVATRTTNRKM